jgi:Raf kinase inhibitor-like YbhB/YbcL family protein
MRRVALVLLVMALLATTTSAGCGPAAGPQPAVPPEGPTARPSTATPVPPTPTPVSPAGELPSLTPELELPMEISSSAFEDQGEIPGRYALCPDQANLSPPLSWSGVPEETQSLALICVDTAVGFLHWALYNIPPTATELPEGLPGISSLEGGLLQGRNDYGEMGYGGPCPPTGDIHPYVFTLYALDVALQLPAGADGESVSQAIEGHILAQAELVGFYSG